MIQNMNKKRKKKLQHNLYNFNNMKDYQSISQIMGGAVKNKIA